MRFLVVLIIVILCATTFAGVGIKGKPYHLVGNEAEVRMNPVWSPDGTMIAFTSSNFIGLWITDSEAKNIRQISDELSAGYGFQWASDAKAIAYKVSKYDGFRRFNALKIYTLDNGSSRQLTDYMLRFSGFPHWDRRNQNILFPEKNSVKVFSTGRKVSKLGNDDTQNRICFLQSNKIHVYDPETKQMNMIEPFKDSRYLDATFSPDRKYIAFQVVGGHMFIIGSDGNDVVDLGPGHRPRWSPDGNRLVYMICEDDGYQFTRSDLYVINKDGTEKQRLTYSDDAFEMNPDWSPAGNAIAYDRLDTGAIYVLELTEE